MLIKAVFIVIRLSLPSFLWPFSSLFLSVTNLKVLLAQMEKHSKEQDKKKSNSLVFGKGREENSFF